MKSRTIILREAQEFIKMASMLHENIREIEENEPFEIQYILREDERFKVFAYSCEQVLNFYLGALDSASVISLRIVTAGNLCARPKRIKRLRYHFLCGIIKMLERK